MKKEEKQWCREVEIERWGWVKDLNNQPFTARQRKASQAMETALETALPSCFFLPVALI